MKFVQLNIIPCPYTLILILSPYSPISKKSNLHFMLSGASKVFNHFDCQSVAPGGTFESPPNIDRLKIVFFGHPVNPGINGTLGIPNCGPMLSGRHQRKMVWSVQTASKQTTCVWSELRTGPKVVQSDRDVRAEASQECDIHCPDRPKVVPDA